MAVYQVKNIAVKSLVKALPVVFVVVGVVIGLFTFFIFPTEVARNLTVGARFLSWIIFVVLYALLMEAGVVVVAWLYNMVTNSLGGIHVELEEVHN